MQNDHENMSRLAGLIRDVKFAMLTTLDSKGQLRSRPMATQKVEFDGELWFFTNGHGGKADEVESDHRVNLAYALPEKNRYVSVSGHAKLVHDPVKMRELWDDSYSEYFPGGLSDPNLALLSVSVEDAEYWDGPADTPVTSIGFTRPVAATRANASKETSHDKVHFGAPH